jgi:hypothetical protein
LDIYIYTYIYEDMILRWIWRRSLDIPPTILTAFLYRYRAATRTREPFCICWCNTVERYEVGKRSDRAEFELKSGNIAICLPIIALPSACRPLDPRRAITRFIAFNISYIYIQISHHTHYIRLLVFLAKRRVRDANMFIA